jgi:hypothetical protein
MTFILLFMRRSFGQSIKQSPVPSDVPRPGILCFNYDIIQNAHLKTSGSVASRILPS